MAAPQLGEVAPDFELVSQSGETVRLSGFVGKKNVVLYFYPKDFTMGCTAEAKAFRDSYQVFQDSDTEVIGVSADSIETHKRFAQRCGLSFTLLSDASRKVRALYGVGSVLGISNRITFVIDKEGIIRYTFSSQLQPTRHVREALDALRPPKTESPKPI